MDPSVISFLQAAILTSVTISEVNPSNLVNPAFQRLYAARVEELKESVRVTGLWPVILLRRVAGKLYLVFGHHRLAVAEKLLGKDAVIKLLVLDEKDCSVSQALRIAFRENLEGSRKAELITIMGIVDAVRQELGLTGLEWAGAKGQHKIVEFLGLTSPAGAVNQRIRIADEALDLYRRGLLALKDVSDYTCRDALQLVHNLRQHAGPDAKASDAAKAAAQVAAAKGDTKTAAAKETEAKKHAASAAKTAATVTHAVFAHYESQAAKQAARQASQKAGTAPKKKHSGDATVVTAVRKALGYKDKKKKAASPPPKPPPDFPIFLEQLSRRISVYTLRVHEPLMKALAFPDELDDLPSEKARLREVVADALDTYKRALAAINSKRAPLEKDISVPKKALSS